jgi:aminoglycoside/choline kinase family phosphotransferase
MAERMADRGALIDAFLARAGWPATRATLAGDASFRRYDRVTRDGRTAVLMDAPPPMENVRPFLAVDRHLRRLGFSAPEVLAEDVDAGLLLLEDLGDDTFTRLLARGVDETALYALATDVLIALHRRPPAEAIPPGLPPYDDRRLQDEAALLTDWFMPAVFGRPTPAATAQEFRYLWSIALRHARAVPETLVLRDFHVDNLIRIQGRDGVAACGLLDFQDAVKGPVAYDLVSLLEDARRDIAPAVGAAMRARYLAAFPALDPAVLDRAMAVLGAQRHAKVIGIFTRLCVRDSKPSYLVHVPRVWRLLEAACAREPVLAPLSAWLDAHIPSALRAAPPLGATNAAPR